MPTGESEFALLRDPRLAAQLAEHAISASPAWLWSSDGSRILWANAVGAAIFAAATASGCTERRFEAKHPAAAEITRLAASLPAAGRVRLERLRGFGASFGAALTCLCSRVVLASGSAAIVVIATEPAGPILPLDERVRRLFCGRQQTLAVFATDGALLYANEAAQSRLGEAPTLPNLGLAAIATEALAAGSASGATRYGAVTVERLGSDLSAALVFTFAALPSGSDAAEGEPTGPAAMASAPSLGGKAGARPSTEPEASAPSSSPAPVNRNQIFDEPTAERRHPLRFVWQMDADGRFVVGSDEFIELLGPRTTAAFGRLWRDIAGELKLDPENQVAGAVATRETWSGITAFWPVDEGGERLSVELSGLPVFDRDREFCGYRGFGVCRDVARINQLMRVRRERPVALVAPLEASSESDAASAGSQRAASAANEAAAAKAPAAETTAELPSREERPPSVAPAAANVVLLRPGMPEPKAPSLSQVERKAFRELAQELTARLQAGREVSAAESDASKRPIEQQTTASETAEAAPARIAAAAIPPVAGEQAEEIAASVAASGAETNEQPSANREAEEQRRAMALSLSAAESEIRSLRARLDSFNKTEEELKAAAREAQKAAAAKTDFIAKASHEIRTPLNTITGFTELILAERFGPISNERYREYLKDMHAAEMHLVSLLNDLLDLSKIETGQLDLAFANVSLNDLTQQCVGIMQPQASRARIIIRTSLTPGLPRVVADERSLRQIVLNLLSNSIKLTGPGGQVIVSTAFADSGEAVLRVRDTGVGMSEKDVEAALEPFGETVNSASWGSGATGLGLPLTKALAEANRAHFSIKSAPNAGTLVEVAFPPGRVVAR